MNRRDNNYQGGYQGSSNNNNNYSGNDYGNSGRDGRDSRDNRDNRDARGGGRILLNIDSVNIGFERKDRSPYKNTKSHDSFDSGNSRKNIH